MKRLVCVEWNEATQQCTTTAWVEEPSQALPPLTIEEATPIAGAILLLWAVAYAFRLALRAANSF